MKKLIYILVALSLNSCSDIIGQKQDDEFKKDQELILIMNQFSKTSAKNEVAQSKADDKTSEIVSKAVETITTLKEENNQMKLIQKKFWLKKMKFTGQKLTKIFR